MKKVVLMQKQIILTSKRRAEQPFAGRNTQHVAIWAQIFCERDSDLCCVFRPANGCSACHSLVEIDFLTLKQLFPSLTEQNKQKIKGKPLKIMQ